MTKIEHHKKTKENSLCSVEQKIQQYILEEKYISIVRTGGNSFEQITGFPLLLSNKLLLMIRVADFRYEGLVIVRIEDIKTVDCDKDDVFYEMLCIKEGVINTGKENNIINKLTDIKDLLLQLKNYKGYIIIQCEGLSNELFCSIGKIDRITESKVFIRCFDRLGIWEQESREILFNDITQVCFDDHYVNVFYKYLQSHMI